MSKLYTIKMHHPYPFQGYVEDEHGPKSTERPSSTPKSFERLRSSQSRNSRRGAESRMSLSASPLHEVRKFQLHILYVGLVTTYRNVICIILFLFKEYENDNILEPMVAYNYLDETWISFVKSNDLASRWRHT